MTFADWITLAGVIGLVIYCVETWKIRKAAEAQLEAQRTPCLTFAATPRDGADAVLDGANRTMILNFDAGDAMLVNIGNGPAVNIEYVWTAKGNPPRELRGYVPFIPPGGRATVPVARNSLQGRPFDCLIEYDSLSFTRYETKLVVENLVLTTPFHFGKAKPAGAKKR